MSDHHEPASLAVPRLRRPQAPTGTVGGRPVDEVAQLYRAEGFDVQIVDLDVDPVVDAASS